MPAAKRAETTPVSRYGSIKKSLGLPRLDAFRRADLTPELRKAAGLTEEDEHRLTACAELSDLGLPAEIAEALALSGAIGSASELAALSVGEVESMLAEEAVKRLLPADAKLDRITLEDWLTRVVPLTADEEAPGRSALLEADAPTLARDEDASLVAEDITLTPDRVAAMLTALKDRWNSAVIALDTLAHATAPVDGAVLRATLADLQGGIAGTLDAVLGPAPDEFIAADEALDVAFADEAVEASVEVARLKAELARITAAIDALSIVAASGSESDSPATATEAGPSERETSQKGE